MRLHARRPVSRPGQGRPRAASRPACFAFAAAVALGLGDAACSGSGAARPAADMATALPFRLASIRDFDDVPWNAPPRIIGDTNAAGLPAADEGLNWLAPAGARPDLNDIPLKSLSYGFRNDRLVRVEIWAAQPHADALLAALRTAAGERLALDRQTGRFVWAAEHFTFTYEGFCSVPENVFAKLILVPAATPVPRPGGHRG